MLPNDPNLAQLRLIAEALGDLRHQLVFVGGSIAGLLMTDPLAFRFPGSSDRGLRSAACL